MSWSSLSLWNLAMLHNACISFQIAPVVCFVGAEPFKINGYKRDKWNLLFPLQATEKSVWNSTATPHIKTHNVTSDCQWLRGTWTLWCHSCWVHVSFTVPRLIESAKLGTANFFCCAFHSEENEKKGCTFLPHSLWPMWKVGQFFPVNLRPETNQRVTQEM